MGAAPAPTGAADKSFKGRTRKRAALGMTVAAAICVSCLGAAGPASAKGGTTTARSAASSTYNVTTDFAIAQGESPVYRQPNTHSGVLNRLAFYTPDSEALQTYEFIGTQRVDGTLWEHIGVPMRPNGQTGWVKRSWLGATQVVHTLIVVNIPTETMTVYNRGKLIFTTSVGTGAPGTPTPTGHFWIAEAFSSNDPVYGPWAFGTTDRATDTDFPDDSIVGIHGTNEPNLVPGDPSHGCIRLKDADILKLKPLVGIGTPVWIQ
jgi:lipoprotein-anchoring transpeptidase ErfK/SrfK